MKGKQVEKTAYKNYGGYVHCMESSLILIMNNVPFLLSKVRIIIMA